MHSETTSKFDITMRPPFPLFQSHLDLAHSYWSQLVQKGDTLIDATCGNGHDTLKLCLLTLSLHKGKVYAIDIQKDAIKSTSHFLISHLDPSLQQQVIIKNQCHSSFPSEIVPGSVKLIVYNLGYLPGSDKKLTTEISTTLKSISQALNLLQKGGALSITCYPGHPEGKRELEEIIAFTTQLSPTEWSCCQHLWLNRKQAPSLLLIQRSCELKIPQLYDSNEEGDRHH